MSWADLPPLPPLPPRRAPPVAEVRALAVDGSLVSTTRLRNLLGSDWEDEELVIALSRLIHEGEMHRVGPGFYRRSVSSVSERHLKLVLVLTAVDQGADTMLKLCEALQGEWAEVHALVDELVELGKLEPVRVNVRRKAKHGGADGHRDADDRGGDG